MVIKIAKMVLGAVALRALNKQMGPEKEKAKEALSKAQDTYSNNMEDIESKQKKLNEEKREAQKSAFVKGMKDGLKSFVGVKDKK